MKTIEFSLAIGVMGKPRQTRADVWKKRPCVMAYRAWADKLRSMLPHDIGKLDAPTTATIAAMATAYWSVYGEETRLIKPEIEFHYCIKRGCKPVYVAGKIDGIEEMPICRLIEYKTTSESLDIDSPYWDRLRGNLQLMAYVDALLYHGYNVAEIVYDVARKPMIRQKAEESSEAYGERLLGDIMDRPGFYFCRRTLPILLDDVERFRSERNMTIEEIFWRRKTGSWPRHIGTATCRGCEFEGFCLQGVQPDADHIPAGYKIGQQHEELEGTWRQ